LVVGAGSAASGYADFPLAVVYLGAVVYLADYALTHEPASLRLAAALAVTPASFRPTAFIPMWPLSRGC
jgi:hypothetical protein